MRISFITLFAFVLVCHSCNPPENQREEEEITTELPPEERAEKILQEEVIAIHDEVMPRMDELMRLKEKLVVKMDSLQNIEAEEQKMEDLKENIEQLKKADSAMMTWMRQFKPVRDTISHEERIEYLKHEKERIEKVREMMLRALEDARSKLD
ncbi:MAG: hypothetical protein ACNS60_06935 [Candidatus Cyclobacteriaceae bacterium M2_1C_046]